MNNKAQMEGAGVILVVAIAIIVGLALYTGGIAPNIGTATQTVTYSEQLSNTTATLDLRGKYIETFAATNATNSSRTIPATNYTISNNVIGSDGELTAQITLEPGVGYATPWNVTYTYQPTGYVTDAGARSVTGLIAILSVLAVAVVALAPTLRNKVMDMIR